MPTDRTDVVVVGAGAAGLVAAADLASAGLEVVVLEADETVGGRVRSEVVDGYVLDRGFQVLNTAYPAVRRRLDTDDLHLCTFPKGMGVRTDRGLTRLELSVDGLLSSLSLLSGTVVRPSDLFRLLRMVGEDALLPAARLKSRPETDVLTALRRRNLGKRAVNTLVRPFLSGVFLDESLATSSRVNDLVWRAFARGDLAVPKTGMQAVSDQLAARAGDAALVLGTPVRAIARGRGETDSGAFRARAVVAAVGPGQMSQLLDSADTPVLNSATTYFHTRSTAGRDDPLLHVDGRTGHGRVRLSSVMNLTATNPSYAPPGKALIASSVVGTEQPPEEHVRAEAARILGTPHGDWEHVSTVHVPDALPAAPPPQGGLRKKRPVGRGPVCGGRPPGHPFVARCPGQRRAGRRCGSGRPGPRVRHRRSYGSRGPSPLRPWDG